jgi:alanyl-tRNA synthetase
MNSELTINTFIDFYRDRGHVRSTDDGLVRPPGDPVLFTTAGMHPLTPYLQGQPHPLGQRLVNVQRCLRTTDLDEIGDSRHLTVFEMLGSWSLGDYDGPQSLRWGFELLRDGFGIDPRRLHVTVYGGDGIVPPDTSSMDTWIELGVPIEVTVEDNWWDNGPVGPCGPDSEIFYWTGDSSPTGTPTTDDRWVEIWNHVMMRYERRDDGLLVPLRQPNVDTGMGLERLLTILQDKPSVFECDIFRPWTESVSSIWQLDERSMRVVSDHLRSSVVMIGDGVRPSNSRHGYVLRRLLRRLLTTLWRDDPSRTLSDLSGDPVRYTGQHFRQTVDDVPTIWQDEERRFRNLLTRGRPLVQRQLRDRNGLLDDGDYHYLHDTHGLPRELIDFIGGGDRD